MDYSLDFKYTAERPSLFTTSREEALHRIMDGWECDFTPQAFGMETGVYALHKPTESTIRVGTLTADAVLNTAERTSRVAVGGMGDRPVKSSLEIERGIKTGIEEALRDAMQNGRGGERC